MIRPAPASEFPQPTPAEIDSVSAPSMLGMRTSGFEVVSSMLLTLCVFCGMFTGVLAVIWLISAGSTLVTAPPKVFGSFAGGASPSVSDTSFEVPSSAEVTELQSASFAQQVSFVSAVDNVLVASNLESNSVGETTGDSDGRGVGPGADDVPGLVPGELPPFDRWQLNFAADTLLTSAQQLDHFGIELAAIGGGVAGVDYASGFTTQAGITTKPKLRHVLDASDEQRLYFIWTDDNPLQRFDAALLGRAGVKLAIPGRVRTRTILRLIPDQLRQHLVALEKTAAEADGPYDVARIAKTVFKCVPSSDGFRFEVVSQRYR